jgi:hypothetical protein
MKTMNAESVDNGKEPLWGQEPVPSTPNSLREGQDTSLELESYLGLI